MKSCLSLLGIKSAVKHCSCNTFSFQRLDPLSFLLAAAKFFSVLFSFLSFFLQPSFSSLFLFHKSEQNQSWVLFQLPRQLGLGQASSRIPAGFETGDFLEVADELATQLQFLFLGFFLFFSPFSFFFLGGGLFGIPFCQIIMLLDTLTVQYELINIELLSDVFL